MDIAVERRYCAWRLVRWVFACAVEVTRRSDSEGGAGPRAANGNGAKWQKYAMTLSCDPRRRGVRCGRCKRCRCATRMLRLSRWAVACAVWGALLRGPGGRGACRRRAVRSRRAGAACELGTCYLELARTGRTDSFIFITSESSESKHEPRSLCTMQHTIKVRSSCSIRLCLVSRITSASRP